MMKIDRTTAAILFTLASLAAHSAEPQKWKLVWHEEFDRDGAPDPAVWNYEEGFIRNREEQYYTADRRRNARVEDGRLILEAHKEEVPNAKFSPGADPENEWQKSRRSAQYTSASLNTLGKASFRYGRLEIRAKIPTGRGSWPALWLMGINRPEVNWPRCGEIDLMENVGKDPAKIHSTLHWRSPEKQGHASSGKSVDGGEPWKEFHLYAMEWSPEKIDFYYDDTLYHSIPIGPGAAAGESFQRPFYLLINLAVGGSWGGEVDPALFPLRYEIDFIRYYKPAQERGEE